MNDLFQQFALLDALLNNWDGIRVRMGVPSASLESEFARIANELNAAQSTDEIAMLIDELLDLTEETGAYEYVRELVARSSVSVAGKTRGMIGETAASELASTDFTGSATDASRCLAPTVGGAVAFHPMSVFFATNRKVEPKKSIEDRYSGEHSNELAYGHVEVTIPVEPHHKMGELERPLPLLGKEDKHRHVVLDEPEGLEAAAFENRLAQALHEKQCKELLIFLHGYNVTFEEAARRAAQIAWDINFAGAVVLFSWPSAGSFLGYGADEERATTAAEPLTTFLRNLEGGPWSKVHLVAHSMGNRVLVSGLANSPGLKLPLSNIILVAADVYVEFFNQKFPAVAKLARRDKGDLVTSYAAKFDRALWLSSWFHEAERIGRFDEKPHTAEGMETIDATSVDSSLLSLRHSYFSNKPSVLTDIGYLVSQGLPASSRIALRSAKNWWAFKQ